MNTVSVPPARRARLRLLNLGKRAIPSALMPAVEWLGSRRIRSVCGLGDYLKVNRHARNHDNYRGEPPFTVRTNALRGAPVSLRPGTSDSSVFIETFVGRFHEPPRGLDPLRIWDLGANLGLTAAHYAALFPRARITAVEAQPTLAAAARRNTARWQSRCNVIEGAISTADGVVEFSVAPGEEYAGHIRKPGERTPCSMNVQGFSLDTLLRDDDVVDFIKMDIEGTEQAVLADRAEWAAKVRCIQVECHGRYSVDHCIADLVRLGFEADRDVRHWASVIGRRDNLTAPRESP